MSNLIAIMGESGSGKTTSLRNFDPKLTFIIDCDKKGLSWRSWRKQYNHESKNYIICDDAADALNTLHYINAQRPEISVIVIDTINGLMVADEGRRRKEKGFDKWVDLAWSVYDLIDEALTMRDDLTIILTAHSQTDSDDLGNRFTRIKTSGRKLDKIVLESKFSYVFLSRRVDGEYCFITQSDDSTAKAGFELFESKIPNDARAVVETIREFEGMPPLDYSDSSADSAVNQ